MSRIGRMPIAIPAGVTVVVAENNKVTVKGPKGTLERVLPVEMEIKVEGATVVEYIHPGNKLATIVAFAEAGVDHQVGRDVAMQAAAMNPVALNRDAVPADIIAKELEIGREKAREEGKPEAILDRIAQGRLDKFFKESTLVEQEFIKDNKMTVGAYAKANNATPTAFKRVTLNQD